MKEVVAFRGLVWKHYRAHGRHGLPWRKTKDPYRILVSEVMLQQTQVARVIEKYKEFLKEFPTVHALAKASLSDVLKIWSGLGYNRRAKYLHDATKQIFEKHGGKVPRDFAALCTLPGVGEYTAKAVRTFAFNKPDVLIETNIRSAFIHSFFAGVPSVNDREIKEQATKAAKGQNPQEWHWALMDYGSHLKRSGVRNNSRSTRYTKQSNFEGSLRQVRGAILRELHDRSMPERVLAARPCLAASGHLKKALAGLTRDGLIVQERGKWRIT